MSGSGAPGYRNEDEGLVLGSLLDTPELPTESDPGLTWHSLPNRRKPRPCAGCVVAIVAIATVTF